MAGASVGKVFDTDGTCVVCVCGCWGNTSLLRFVLLFVGLALVKPDICQLAHQLLCRTGLALGGTDEHARFTFQGLVHDATTRRWHALVGGANGEGVPWLFAQVLKPMRPIQLEQYALSMARFASGMCCSGGAPFFTPRNIVLGLTDSARCCAQG